ncbi:hypothetical protein [Natrinema pallidum]|uniref:hypothetical protein n=1 Tax=Natrinema pallidum TaxID=69527 RepID=UPI0012697DD6|nr:hypothetical protein [Natrinema pallidum]
MKDDSKLNRRTVIKSTGIALGTISTVAHTTAAQESEDDVFQEESNECFQCPQLIEETSNYRISTVSNEGGAYLLKANKESSSVSILDQAESVDVLDTNTRVSTQGNPIIEDYEVHSYHRGDCNGVIYDDHYASVVEINTGENVEGLPETALSGAICAIPGLAGGPAGSVIAGIVCALGYQLFLGHVDIVGTDFSIGLWDDHVGWAGEEAIRLGGANSLESHHSDLSPGKHYKGLHIAADDPVEKIIDIVN